MLKILNVPNKSLVSATKTVKKIDSKVRRLVKNMEKLLEIQDDPPGVGLAAPQVGLNLKLFIIKPTPKAKMEVFINPKVLVDETATGGGGGGTRQRAGGIFPSTGGRKPPTGPVADQDPTLTKKPKNTKLEGCLSIPRIWAPVHRQKTVKLTYQDDKGEEKTATFSGFKATIIQHEIDHLNGVLFTQRSLEQGSQIYKEDKAGKLKKIEY